jgi:tetratricopeptide (TPR) repeat protein
VSAVKEMPMKNPASSIASPSTLIASTLIVPTLLSALLAVLLSARAGWAAETSAADAAPEATTAVPRARFSEEALVLYKARDYRHAAEKFLQAYSIDHDSNLLFNIARCYEALGDSGGAIEKYEAFLATPDADVEGKRRATLAIHTLRQATNATTTTTAPPAAPAANPDAELASTVRVHSGSSAAESYKTLSAEGLAFYKAGEYRRSGEKFLQAYAFDPDPNLIFNVARCYAALGDTAAAIEKYEAFLKAPGTDLDGRKHAQANLAKLRQAPTALRATPVEHEDLAVEPRSGRTRIAAGWTATALLTVGTVVMGVLALESASKLEAARRAFPSSGPDIASRASRTTTLTLSADALGIGAVLMGGLSLYWTFSGPSTTSSSELSVALGARTVRIAGSF